MKRVIIFGAILFFIQSSLFSQCSTVPVKEAVRNGDFEAGYLGGATFTGAGSPAATHPAVGTGGLLDFSSDLKYAGMWSPNGPCKYSIDDQYGVGRVENPSCNPGGSGNKNTVYGQYGGDNGAAYKDHTTGTDQGFALFFDFNSSANYSTPANAWKKVWSQTVPVYPNQMYYFSAWFAQYRPQANTANLRFRVDFLDAGNAMIGSTNVLGAATPNQGWTWQQFKSNLPSPVNAAKAVLYIECLPSWVASMDDLLIDDISFINSCQNIASSTTYSVEFAKDSVNLCSEGGSYLAQILKTTGGNLTAAGKVITWYRGAGATQTEIPAWANQVNPTITQPDVYRACVEDAANGCPVSATIVAYESVSYSPPDVTLCSPSSYTYDAGYTFPNNAMTIAWLGPSGAGTGKTYVANKPGSHTVTISPAGGHTGCALTKTFTVSSNLPTAPTNLEYCDGGGSSTALTLGDGKKYKWSTSQTMTPLIGSGTSVSWTPTVGTTGDQVLYLQSANATSLGTLGPTASFSGYQEAGNAMTFTTTKATVFNSFVVTVPSYACPWMVTQIPITFNLTGQSAYTQNITCGSNTTITPAWDLPAGTYSLSVGGATNLCFATGVGTATIGGGTVTVATNGSNHYMAADLNFSNSDACDPIPVTIKAKSCCTPPTDNPDIDLVISVLSVCNPNKATIVSKTGLTNGLDYKWQVSHDGGTTWMDTLTSGTVAGGKVTLSDVGVSGSYRLVVATAGNIEKSCVKNSPAATVNIKPLPTNIAISVNPNKTSFCKGEAHVLTATATAGATFQWKYDGTGTAATTDGLTTAGPHKYKVIATLNSCVDSSAMMNITVNPTDSAKILPAGPFCSVDANYTMQLTAGSVSGGTWSGTGITAGGVFSPSIGNGTYNLTYSTAGSCPNSDNISVTVSNSVVLNITSTKSTYCHNANKDTIEVTSLGGKFSTWSGKGMVDADFGYYDPKLANIGNDTIWYMKAGSCGDTTFKVITVTDVDTAKITTPQGPFCQSQGVVTLRKEAISDAGIWSGTGITNGATGAFDPSVGSGNYLITYKTSGACQAQDTATIKVFGQMLANIVTPDTTMCKNASAKQIRLSSNSTPGGLWLSAPTSGLVSNTGLFTPTTAGVFKVYYGIAGATLTCSAADSVLITVSSIDTAKISAGQGPFCLNDPVQTLKVESASSTGTWSGTGITNANTGTYNPSTTTGVGAHLITYKTSGTCWVQDTMTIYVVNQMVANITNTTAFVCEDAGLYTIQKSGNSTPGGTWTSIPAGVVNNNGQFDPSLGTAGITYKVLYSVSGATATCSAKDSIDITIVPREEAQITSGTTLSLCTYDVAEQLSALNPGGTWSGTGVSASGLFDPAVATAGGPYAVKYKINGATGSCPDEDTIMITVIAPKDASIQAAGPFCENLPQQQLVANTEGGTFSGAGVSGSGMFDPATAGQGLHWIKYTQGGLCANTDSIQIQVDALPAAVIAPDVTGGCVPLTISFADSSTADIATAHWDFGDGSSQDISSADASTSHVYSVPGNGLTVKLSVVFLNGCVDSTTQKVSIAAVPQADFSFGPIPASSNDPQITFVNQSSDATDYLWNFGSTALPDTSINIDEVVRFDAPDGDTILVTLMAKNSVCTDSVKKEVYIKDVFTLFTENAFTPDGDGINDVFYPRGKNHVCETCRNYEFVVYNRWGEVIFRSNTPYEGWNGKHFNTMRDAEIDVYVWRLTYTDSFTEKKSAKTGHITLLK
ncbi:MAG: gliding motility-associated C-terminal domain-containing protein [Flavobacteriales bacterium]